MTDDIEEPVNDVPDEPAEPPAGAPPVFIETDFPDDDAIDSPSEDDATTTPEAPTT